MGNQISCDIGSIFIEITIMLFEQPNPYERARYYHLAGNKETFYFLHYEKAKIHEFKNHPLYEKIEKISEPVQVSGITYDDYYHDLSHIFECSFVEAIKQNYTFETLKYYWKNSKDLFFSFKTAIEDSPDGSLLVNENIFAKIPVEDSNFYPFLLVSVKSGVSIYDIRSENQLEKIGGSCLGLSSLWGLMKCHEIENADDLFEEILTGNNANVDMTVGDIYGCGYLNLPEKLTASTCGKLKDHSNYSIKDLWKSLVFMLLFNLGQISAMHCFDLGMTKVVIVGSAFVNEKISKMMNFAFNYSSRGRLQLIMCENSQHLRSMGVILKSIA